MKTIILASFLLAGCVSNNERVRAEVDALEVLQAHNNQEMQRLLVEAATMREKCEALRNQP